MSEAVNPALLEIIYKLSFKTGAFTLTSGAISNYYIDLRVASTHPEGAVLMADELLKRIQRLGLKPASIGGMELGAVPVVAAVTTRSAQFGTPMPCFIVRKHAKKHGAGKRIEGHIKDGDAVVVVDDTVTTAKSAVETVDAVLEEYPNCKILTVLAVVDRQEGGRELIEKRGIPFSALITREDLFARDSEVHQKSGG